MYCAMIDKIATQELTFEITGSLQTVWKRWFVLFVMNVCLSCILFRCDLVCMKNKHKDLKCILPNILLPLKTWTRHNKLVANLLAEACGNCTNTMSHFTIILHCMDLHVNIVNIVFFSFFPCLLLFENWKLHFDFLSLWCMCCMSLWSCFEFSPMEVLFCSGVFVKDQEDMLIGSLALEHPHLALGETATGADLSTHTHKVMHRLLNVFCLQNNQYV